MSTFVTEDHVRLAFMPNMLSSWNKVIIVIIIIIKCQVYIEIQTWMLRQATCIFIAILFLTKCFCQCCWALWSLRFGIRFICLDQPVFWDDYFVNSSNFNLSYKIIKMSLCTVLYTPFVIESLSDIFKHLLKIIKQNIRSNCSDNYQTSHVMRLWYFSSSEKTHSSNALTQPSSRARCLIFGRTLRLLPYFMCSCVRTAKALARLRGCTD